MAFTPCPAAPPLPPSDLPSPHPPPDTVRIDDIETTDELACALGLLPRAPSRSD